jgi:CSLREA domain-containing protein
MRVHWSTVRTALWGGRWRRLAIGCAFALGLGFFLAACQGGPGTLDLKVNTTHDGHDANPGDGVCAMTPGRHDCSLRAALEEGNASSTDVPNITVPSGRYVLTAGPLVTDPASGSAAITSSGQGASIVASGASTGFEATGGSTLVTDLAVTGASGAGFDVSSGATLVVTSGSSNHNGTGFVVEAGGIGATGETTLSDNTGAGVDDGGTFHALFTTITANGGGGIDGSGTTSLQGTIVSSQASGADCAAPVTSQGYNLDGDGTCGLTQAGDLAARPANLAPLSNALVPWHPLRLLSPALNVVPTGVGNCSPGQGSLDQRGRPRLVGGGCDVGAVEASFPPITLTVRTTSDEDGADDIRPGDGLCVSGLKGACTLRAAIEEANAYTSSGDTIDIEISGSLEWFEPLDNVAIIDPLTIHGNGTTLFAGQHPHVLEVDAPTSIDHMTLTGAFTHESGAGILASAPLTIDHVSVSGNEAINTGGAGIVTSADLTVTDSTISGNFAGGGGDSALLATGGTTTIVDSTISGNFANSSDDPEIVDAPAVDLRGTSATITGSTINGNEAGLSSVAGATTLLLDTPTATVTNTTISGNGSSVPFDQLGHQTGGVGVAVRSGSARFVDDTFSGNAGQQDPFTLQFTGPTIEVEGSLTLEGTIVSAPPGLACATPLASSGGYNIVSDTTCGLTATGDEQGTDALLGVLANNGGPTQTQLPGAGSPAIDAVPVGTSGLCDGSVTTDQRGVARPTGPACDIGSVEQ